MDRYGTGRGIGRVGGGVAGQPRTGAGGSSDERRARRLDLDDIEQRKSGAINFQEQALEAENRG